MKKIIMIITLLVFTQSVSAISPDEVGWHKLTDKQKVEVLQKVTEYANAPATMEVAPQQVDQWVDVGRNVATAINETAKGLGVIVNDFIKSPVGMIAMGLIIWQFMGAMIFHMVGSMLLVIGSALFIWWHSKISRSVIFEYSPDKVDIFGRSRLLSKKIEKLDNDYATAYVAIVAVVFVAAIILAFSY